MPPKNACEVEWYLTHVKPHEAYIRHWLQSRYGDYCDVDDVLQEALLRLLKTKEGKEILSVKAYLFALARNIAVDTIRKSKVRVTTSIDDESMLEMIEDGMEVDEIVARNHELEILTRAIQSLPDRCQRIFTLSKVYGMSYKQIASELGISFHTVSAQITIGLSKCTEYVRKHTRN